MQYTSSKNIIDCEQILNLKQIVLCGQIVKVSLFFFNNNCIKILAYRYDICF